MNNGAYEKYQAQQPAIHHEPKAIDPFDGETTNTEIGVAVVFALAIAWAIYKSIFTDKKDKKDE